MTDYISPAERHRRYQLTQRRSSPEAQLSRYQQKGRELDEKAKKAIREQLSLQRRQGQNAKYRVDKSAYKR